MAATEHREVRVARGGAGVNGSLTIAAEPPWTLRLAVNGREFSAQESDLFECLVTVRRQLERDGSRICCLGARPDVFPSGMGRQMGGGRRAYRHHPGRRPTRDDLVDIFDPADCEDVVMVQEQEARMRSLRD